MTYARTFGMYRTKICVEYSKMAFEKVDAKVSFAKESLSHMVYVQYVPYVQCEFL